MQKTCKNCTQPFEPTSHHEKFHVPAPTLCYECRQQRRLAWRNEHKLYKRTCDLCQKPIISVHHDKTPFEVYCNECWWSDKWTPPAQDFDFSRPFFEQFHELLQKTPRINLSASNNENCDYVNYTNYSKDSYLAIGGHRSERCFYTWRTHDSLDCFECAQCNKCRHCLECTDCDNCYELSYGQLCQGCDNSYFLYYCRSCSECFLCCNLTHKKHHILNKQHSPEEYKEKVATLLKKPLPELLQMFEEIQKKHPRKHLNMTNCENSLGNYLVNCQNCTNVHSGKECRDCHNVFMTERAHDCVDCDVVGWPAELCYEGISTCVHAFNNKFSSTCWTCSDIEYCDSCFNSENLFGCIGLRHKKFHVLNKPQEDYENLRKRIIEHMKETGEYGEFFPIEISPFDYEETIAQDYYPI